MTDIVPELSEAVAKQFEARARSDPRLAKIAGKIRDGTATMANAHEYAESVGEILSDVFLDLVGEGVLPNDIMYYNIAKRIVEPALRNNYDLITEAAKLIQKHVDSKEGIGIESVPAPFPDERVAGLIDKITEETTLDGVRRWLGEPIVNNSEAFVDDFVRENAKVRAGMGLATYIVRKSSPGCCAWCSSLVGRYSYGDEPREVYSRHEFCRCVVTAEYEKGGRQDVWSKREWTVDQDELNARKAAGSQDKITPQEHEAAAARLERDRQIAEYQDATGFSRRTAREATLRKSQKKIAADIAKIQAYRERMRTR